MLICFMELSWFLQKASAKKQPKTLTTEGFWSNHWLIMAKNHFLFSEFQFLILNRGSKIPCTPCCCIRGDTYKSLLKMVAILE